MEEALFLTHFANSVLLIHRRDGWRASKIMQERVTKHEKIKMRTNRTVRRWLMDGGGNTSKELKFLGAELEDPTKPGFREKVAFDGAFLAIGKLTVVDGYMKWLLLCRYFPHSLSHLSISLCFAFREFWDDIIPVPLLRIHQTLYKP